MKITKTLLIALLITLSAITGYARENGREMASVNNLSQTDPLAIIFLDNYAIGVSAHYYADVTVKFYDVNPTTAEMTPAIISGVIFNYRVEYENLVEPEYNTVDHLYVTCSGSEVVIRYGAPIQSDPYSSYQSWANYYWEEEGSGYYTYFTP